MAGQLVRFGGPAVLGALCAAAACSRPPSSPPPAVRRAPAVVTSNVTRADYAGSAACAGCHPDETSSWARSPMHLMTRDPRGASVRAPFDGTRWRFKDDGVVLSARGSDRWVRVEPASGSPTTYRVTRIVGGRTREDYVGVADGGRLGSSEEVVLPVSYVFATGSLRYKGYSVMVHERSGLRAGPAWAKTCVFCHNTIPEMDRLVGAIAGPHAPPYQGQQVDAWLPEDRRARTRVSDAAGFSRALRGEVERVGGAAAWSDASPATLARHGVDALRSSFDGADLVEVGIGCEACHGGAAEHVRDPSVQPSFIPVAPWLDVQLPGSKTTAPIDRVCARCHQVLFSRYPYTWEGGRRDAAAGGSHINSGEARDFLLGACQSALSCTRCHDPHGGTGATSLAALATPAGNSTCTGCHPALADRERLRAHAHHEPSGPGGACVACHMPRKNMGLDGVLTRYHRIGSPTDPARVLGDRPLECALCHAGESVATLVDTMEKWWPVRYPRQRLEELYGSTSANVMRATLDRGKPHERAVAIASLGEARVKDAAPDIARELLDPYPLVRQWARKALVDILGRCEVDLSADDATIARDATACVGSRVDASPAPPQPNSPDEDPED